MEDVSSTKKQRGGRRTNAGRKKAVELRFDPSHAARPELSSNHAVHLMLRTLPSVPRLRQRAAYEVLRSVLVYFVEANDFRVVHVSIQRNHLHFIVEASDKHALSRGMQRFAIRAARAINGTFDRTGKVFAFRYHAKQIKTADYARNAISYVLNNWRRHRQDVYCDEMSMPFDRYSSASAFDGWCTRKWKQSDDDWPISAPRTVLLQFDWQLFGLIDPFEVPGALPN
jgi:REP element-mobilizing transposase RayT